MGIRPYIQFYPTLRCNYHCQFCFNKGLPATDDVALDDFTRIASILKDAGIECIDILGGEPTLHPGLLLLLDIVNRQQMKSNLSSNGTNIAALSSLSERYDREFLRIGISINDQEISEDLHTYIMRHKPVLKSVMTVATGIPKSGRQYLDLPGIDYYLLYRDSADKQDLEHCMPFYQFYEKLTDLKRRNHGLNGVFCSGFISEDDNCHSLQSVRCPAGTAKLSLLADGSVYPCYLFFRHKEFELGNILKDDFQKIWQHPILNFFQTFSGNKCPDQECNLFPSCHGGCPAMSYLAYHKLDAPDPRCLMTT